MKLSGRDSPRGRREGKKKNTEREISGWSVSLQAFRDESFSRRGLGCRARTNFRMQGFFTSLKTFGHRGLVLSFVFSFFLLGRLETSVQRRTNEGWPAINTRPSFSTCVYIQWMRASPRVDRESKERTEMDSLEQVRKKKSQRWR